jgi:hypothetical protein
MDGSFEGGNFSRQDYANHKRGGVELGDKVLRKSKVKAIG